MTNRQYIHRKTSSVLPDLGRQIHKQDRIHSYIQHENTMVNKFIHGSLGHLVFHADIKFSRSLQASPGFNDLRCARICRTIEHHEHKTYNVDM